MNHRKTVIAFYIGFLLICSALHPACGQQFDPWPEIKAETKPWTRWWWMGSAVDEKNLDNLLETYARKGFGGVEITPIYGVKGYENHYIPFLSKHWMEMLRYTCKKSASLNMGVDINNGTGWPFGGPHITPDNAASKIIIQQYKLTEGKEFSEKIMVTDKEQRNAGSELQALIAYRDKGREIQDLTDRISPDGALTKIPLLGDWTLYAAFCGKTHQKVKRAAPGGEGYTFDHFSTRALEQYLSRFDSAFDGDPLRIRCLFNDSYEVYNASWTPSFFEEFSTRRGYNLKNYIRELADAGERSIVERVKSDYRQTMSEMMLDHFTMNWTRWAHSHSMLTRNQAHGSPANLLDLYAAVDIPEIETFGSSYFPVPGLRHDSSHMRMADHDPLFLRLASSAAHVSGKRLVSCETFTWLGEHFRVALSQCKPEVEQAFLAGVNHVIYHGTTYSPEDVPWPGWLFYASVNFAPSNSFWPHLDGLNHYITRCQSILQSGLPDNEILVYWPIYDQWQQADKLEKMVSVHEGRTWLNLPQVSDLSENGYSFDFISDKQLLETKAREGKLITASGESPYRVLFIPACRYMPLETLTKIIGLVNDGAYVVMEQIPEGVPGLFEYKLRNREFHQLLKKLKLSVITINILMAKGTKGTLLVCPDAVKAMEYIGIMPESLGDKGLKFIRRKSEKGTYYYLVNHTSVAVNSLIPLNVTARTFLLLDPMTGEWGKIPVREKDSTSLIRIQLLPGETCFVFAAHEEITGLPEWSYYQRSLPETIIKGPWELEFISGDTTLSRITRLESPIPWTSLGLKEAECFSGLATYSAEFTVTDTYASEYMLVIDKLYESARIWINGKETGVIWSVPFQCKVARLLQPGVNTIRCEVANLMANRIRAMDIQGIEWKKFHDINMVNIGYKPFDASDWSILPSGLGGTVKLVPLLKD
ncbi:MAG: glycosyl hydrolase family 2 [Bacteroidales bacterium]|nr:glycosyl hydrolase family 2 [Bacteroidales bacterium]